MNERTLMIIAIFIILFGLPLLYVTAQDIEVHKKTVTIEGIVTTVHHTNGVTILSVKPSKGIPVVFFDKKKYEKGDRVIIEGILKEYQGRVEIVVE